MFGRYTLDDTSQFLPTDYPQFPREFFSRNQFFTGEYRHVFSDRMLNTTRLGYSRTRVGQNVEANTTEPVSEFVPGRGLMGAIDIGGLKRFGPQTSANLRLVQNVFSLQNDMTYTAGRHLLKGGLIAEHYQENMVNPTFSLGIYRFLNLRNFVLNVPATFVGLTPEAQFDRYWRFTFLGAYLQDDFQVTPHLTVNAGLRYETTTMPADKYGRDSALPNLMDQQPTVGPPVRGSAAQLLAARRFRVGCLRRRHTVAPRRLRAVLQHQQPPEPDRHRDQSARHAAAGHRQSDVPEPRSRGPARSRSARCSGTSSRRACTCSTSTCRGRSGGETSLMVGYAGSRGNHLWRSNDVNTALPTTLADGTVFFPTGTPRQNTAFTTIELKSSDGESWYDALIVDVRKRFAQGFSFQSSYTLSKSEDTTQASTFFSDATNGTTTAFPEYIPGYNKGPSDWDTRHNWVLNFTADLPGIDGLFGLLNGWQASGIWTMRSGQPLTVFVQGNRSRSQWNPSIGPGLGLDRPSYAPGLWARQRRARPRGPVVRPGCVRAAARRHLRQHRPRRLPGPGPAHPRRRADQARPVDEAGRRRPHRVPPRGLQRSQPRQLRPPGADRVCRRPDHRDRTVLSTFGRITTTVTSSRQIQLGVKVYF